MSSSQNPDVLVLGGGIVGLACARALAQERLVVDLLEGGAIGRKASWAAGGMLAPLSEVREAGPLFSACQEARDQWHTFHADVTEEGRESVEYDRSGALVTASDDAEEAVLDEMKEAAATLGEPSEEVSVDAVREWIPDITPSVRRALRLPNEHRVDNVEFCRVLAGAAAHAGVRVRTGVEVQALAPQSDSVKVQTSQGEVECGRVVVATGAWLPKIAPLDALPVVPRRGQMLRVGGAAWPWSGNVRVGGHYYGIRRAKDCLLFGATLEDVGFADHTTVGGIRELLDVFQSKFPGLAGSELRSTWSGLRPGTPDDLPIVGQFHDQPIWIAGGHYRNGILLAPWTAERIRKWVLSPESEPRDNPFRTDRFDSPPA